VNRKDYGLERISIILLALFIFFCYSYIHETKLASCVNFIAYAKFCIRCIAESAPSTTGCHPQNRKYVLSCSEAKEGSITATGIKHRKFGCAFLRYVQGYVIWVVLAGKWIACNNCGLVVHTYRARLGRRPA